MLRVQSPEQSPPARPPEAFLDYCRVGHTTVEGWLEPGVLTLLSIVAEAQTRMGVAGPVAEIGIHHGRFFLALMLSRPGAKGVAIDIFEDQHLNPDGSGQGSQAAFTRNLARFRIASDDVVIRKADSRTVTPAEFRRMTGPAGVSVFSVDGAHTVAYTLSDLDLAAAVIARNGVIILDDFFNPRWPGVNEALFQWLAGPTGRSFSVFMYGNNKAFLARGQASLDYAGAVKRAPERLRSIVDAQLASRPTLFVSGRFMESIYGLGGSATQSLWFARGRGGQYHLGQGWADAEQTGVWAIERKATIDLPVEAFAGRKIQAQLDLSTFVPKGQEQRIRILVDGKGLYEQTWTRSERVSIPLADIQVPEGARSVPVVIDADRAFVPKTFGDSADDRSLVVKLTRIDLIPS